MNRKILFMLGLIFEKSPKYFLGSILYNVIRGFSLAFANVIFLKLLFNNIQNNAAIEKVFGLIVVYLVYQLVVSSIFSWYWKYFQPVYSEDLKSKLEIDMYKKCSKVAYEKYDNPNYYNNYIWALKSIQTSSDGVLNSFCEMVQGIVATITIIITVLTIDWFFLVIFVVFFMLSLLAEKGFNDLIIRKTTDVQPIERENIYINRVFFLKDYSCDLRSSKIRNVLFGRYDKTIDKLKDYFNYYGKRLSLRGFLKDLISILVADVGAVIYLLFRLFITHSILMGDFTAAFNSIGSLRGNILTIFNQNRELRVKSVYIDKYMKFLKNDTYDVETKGITMPTVVDKIEIKDLKYSYDTGRVILENLNLTIKKGEKIAIVGQNGAGKSTLIKIFLRLLQANEGTITINDLQLNEINKDSFYDNVCCLFQDFQIYAAQINENIKMDVLTEQDKPELFEDAIKKCGLEQKVAGFERGVSTQLTREYDNEGVNLSGGECQKLAIARVFYKNTPIIILDEPTSALDADAEYELYSSIVETFKDHIVILITHRLAAARSVDKIFYIENGAFSETGNHNELMELDGKYAHMFRLQAEKYKIHCGYPIETATEEADKAKASLSNKLAAKERRLKRKQNSPR